MTAATPASREPARARTEFEIEGMTCSNCARHVTEAIQHVPGVEAATVLLEDHRGTVRWASGASADPLAVVSAVAAAGYKAKPLSPGTTEGASDHTGWWGASVFAGVIPTALLMLGEWLGGWGHEPWFRWISFVLALIVQAGPGTRFYRGAWNQLKVGSSNMDTLVALGSTTAFVYSCWLLFSGSHDHLYFMEAAAIITLVSVGHWLEARVSAKAASSLRALLNLAPATTRRARPDGSEEEVAVAQLRPGDRVIIKPGDQIPTDGVVEEGTSAVDESMLTGESIPVDKAKDSSAYAGTVNLNGRLVVRVTATGEETALAHIVEAVQRAQSSRANIQRLGDKVSNIFVPVVVAAAIGAGLLWGLAPETARSVAIWLGQYLWTPAIPENATAAAVFCAVAVLIVACPCAMGLATPTAIMAGSNVAAERGILIRDGVALEKAGNVTAVMFDKTGTLTSGRPVVVESKEFQNLPGPLGKLVVLAATVARRSNHPLSRAVAALSAEDMPLLEWQEVRGSGIQASAEIDQGAGTKRQVDLQFGSVAWLRMSGIDISPGHDFLAQWSARGATVVGLAVDGKLAAMLAIRDTVKPGAAQVVREIQAQKLRTYLITGDNPLTAASIARECGIPEENVLAEVRPEQKAQLVAKLQAAGERVAFVGDGINDAPALEQADLGIAVSRASDIARAAADIVLLNSEIEAVPESLGLARATLRTIKQNLFWAFFYNALGVPLAALGFLSPILCAAAMGFSDLILIGNALRLRRWKSRRRGRSSPPTHQLAVS